jgi:hypothetical protein
MTRYTKLFFTFCLSMSFFQLAFATSIEAPGQVFYKMPSGEIVNRDVSLVVPMKGEGDVFLKYGAHEVKAEKFWTEHSSGRAVFYVSFVNPPGAPENTTVLFRGSYIRGTNRALYYGDMFKKIQSNLSSTNNQTKEGQVAEHPDLLYIGGFTFKSEIN